MKTCALLDNVVKFLYWLVWPLLNDQQRKSSDWSIQLLILKWLWSIIDWRYFHYDVTLYDFSWLDGTWLFHYNLSCLFSVLIWFDRISIPHVLLIFIPCLYQCSVCKFLLAWHVSCRVACVLTWSSRFSDLHVLASVIILSKSLLYLSDKVWKLDVLAYYAIYLLPFCLKVCYAFSDLLELKVIFI